MSRITRDTAIDGVKDDAEKWRFLVQWLEELVSIINNGLKFSDNFDSKIINVTFSAANTDTSVAHGLGRAPAGYLVTSLSASMVIYNGSVGSNGTNLILRSSATGSAGLIVY